MFFSFFSLLGRLPRRRVVFLEFGPPPPPPHSRWVRRPHSACRALGCCRISAPGPSITSFLELFPDSIDVRWSAASNRARKIGALPRLRHSLRVKSRTPIPLTPGADQEPSFPATIWRLIRSPAPAKACRGPPLPPPSPTCFERMSGGRRPIFYFFGHPVIAIHPAEKERPANHLFGGSPGQPVQGAWPRTQEDGNGKKSRRPMGSTEPPPPASIICALPVVRDDGGLLTSPDLQSMLPCLRAPRQINAMARRPAPVWMSSSAVFRS